jgi:hypothetical protein
VLRVVKWSRSNDLSAEENALIEGPPTKKYPIRLRTAEEVSQSSVLLEHCKRGPGHHVPQEPSSEDHPILID